jgi:hypothetical protein
VKQYTLKDGKTAYCYLEKGPDANVVVTLVETETPGVYSSLRHAYYSGDLGATEFNTVTSEDVEAAAQKAKIVSGTDESGV